MSPAPRAAALLAACAALAALAGPLPGAAAAVAVLTATVLDAVAARRPPAVERRVAPVLARGVAAPLVLAADAPSVLLRQPLPPDVDAGRRVARQRLETELVPRRRGRHRLPAPVARRDGPLGLGRWDHRPGAGQELLVYPDFPAARRLAQAVRQGRLREAGRVTRGPLGLGTDFESIRDYLPDDDIRQVNWPATQRMGRPMSNQYRVEQDREVVLLVDAGRLMAAPLGEATRLDVAIDAATAVALVADEVGDRCGVVGFDAAIRRRLPPRRAGGGAIVRALFDLEPSSVEADYELAFRTVEAGKRSLVVLFSDLLEEAAARSLLDAVPVLARRHLVVAASAADPDLEARAAGEDPWAAAVAREVLAARERVAARLRRAGALVVEAPAPALGRACVRAYLRAKARGRL
ncbi:MAG TPA: DUF58 domain-containing protein [Solirubrobacteraceae bacterium]|nr:DUF58 domain-containing protein [Solirubrobacteraceae bacterium]